MTNLNLVPLPVHVEQLAGTLVLDELATLHDPLGTWVPMIRHHTLLPFASGDANATIRLRIDDSLPSEAYSLAVTESNVDVVASGREGFQRAWATFAQLLPVNLYGRSAKPSQVTVPCVRIEDAPRFGWRGSHLDVARHFMPLDFLYRYIDLLAMHKFNRFHLHLTEDQGWRMEIEAFPKLTSVGGWRRRSMLGHVSEERWDEQPVGGFYSKAQLRALVAYAAARGIEIMPEIELPGHAQAALAAYPEFGNTGESIDVWDRWGVSYNVFAPTDQTLGFLKDVLREVMDVFPFSFIHIGGDECPKTQWKHSPVAQDRMRAEGLKDEDELQSWFIGQIGRFLADHGRRMVGWDEILEGGLPSGATVMSWRGEAGGIAAARAGHDVIMTPGKPTYFDHYQAEDKETEPIAIGGCNVLESVYAYEPVPSDLTEAEAAHVLGSQFQIWTEYMKTPAKVEYMAFPRACALSEVLWTPREHRDWSGFQARLGHHEARMTEMGVHFRSQHPNPSNRTLR